MPNTRLVDLRKPILLKGNKNSQLWEFSVTNDQIQQGRFLNQLWAREKVESLRFLRTIGFLDQMSFEKQVIDLALQHQVVTKFTSLVAVDDENISRNSDQPIFSHQIAQNIPDGWIDPNVIKHAGTIQNLMTETYFFNTMKKIELEELPSLKVNFVQTDTNKKLFYLLTIILLTSAIFLFFLRKRLY